MSLLFHEMSMDAGDVVAFAAHCASFPARWDHFIRRWRDVGILRGASAEDFAQAIAAHASGLPSDPSEWLRDLRERLEKEFRCVERGPLAARLYPDRWELSPLGHSFHATMARGQDGAALLRPALEACDSVTVIDHFFAFPDATQGRSRFLELAVAHRLSRVIIICGTRRERRVAEYRQEDALAAADAIADGCREAAQAGLSLTARILRPLAFYRACHDRLVAFASVSGEEGAHVVALGKGIASLGDGGDHPVTFARIGSEVFAGRRKALFDAAKKGLASGAQYGLDCRWEPHREPRKDPLRAP